MMKQDKIPHVYRQTGAYARAHNELDQFRNSNIQNALCCEAIEQAISNGFDGFRLNPEVVTPVINTFGVDRVQYVLANTVQLKMYDGRFSEGNKQWANTIQIVDDNGAAFDRRLHFAINSHPVVLDGFISLARKEIQERIKPSVLDRLKAKKPKKEVAEKKVRTQKDAR